MTILALLANVFHIGLQAVQEVAIDFAAMDPPGIQPCSHQCGPQAIKVYDSLSEKLS